MLRRGRVEKGPAAIHCATGHFYTFMLNELVPLIDRWRENYAAEHP